jgi:hypothetical protein
MPVGIHSITNMVQNIAMYLGHKDYENYTGHGFRRSSATALLEKDATVEQTKAAGGWTSDKTVQGYYHKTKKFKKSMADKFTMNNNDNNNDNSFTNYNSKNVSFLNNLNGNSNDFGGMIFSNNANITINISKHDEFDWLDDYVNDDWDNLMKSYSNE